MASRDLIGLLESSSMHPTNLSKFETLGSIFTAFCNLPLGEVGLMR